MTLLSALFMLCSTLCFSQQQYEFDYLLEYKIIIYKDSFTVQSSSSNEKNETFKKYYFTNSKKNNYSAIITDLDSLHYSMIFKDENGISSRTTFLKTDLNNAEFINIECKDVYKYRNDFKYRTEEYDFFKLNDTLIKGKTYGKYKFASIKPKKEKRHKLASKYYIIDRATAFHLPLFELSTPYEKWKLQKTLPSGLFYEKYRIDYYGKLNYKETLINYWKIDKKIMINTDCDYTKKTSKKNRIPASKVHTSHQMN
ncbi:hypothetical protein ES677_01900 [Bizionia gelidisalsuginis]|uniref:GLPGLI family protein n=1 Tax=Bizionia gelidisalsuginis TaxID=291188 RepID=A0ABY3MEW6_9FLAO|nr:hypothetical protein [Bizionia gelidisalsuginis]TYC18157.1 hypothetical protein ES677_01900 [Bizionia gelidisalsuginis]